MLDMHIYFLLINAKKNLNAKKLKKDLYIICEKEVVLDYKEDKHMKNMSCSREIFACENPIDYKNWVKLEVSEFVQNL